MVEHPKSTGGFYHPDWSPCIYLGQLLQVAGLLGAAGGDDVGLEGAEVVVGEAD